MNNPLENRVLPFYAVRFQHQDMLIDSLKTLEKKIGKYDFYTADIPVSESLSDRVRFVVYAKTDYKKKLPQRMKKLAKLFSRYTAPVFPVMAGYISIGQVVLAYSSPGYDRIYYADDLYLKQQLIWNGEKYVVLSQTSGEFRQNIALNFFNQMHRSLLQRLK